MEDAQQQGERRRAARDGPKDANVPPKASAPSVAPPTEKVDHAAIFASGVMPPKKTHYSILGVPRSAGPDEVRKAYNKLAMKWCALAPTPPSLESAPQFQRARACSFPSPGSAHPPLHRHPDKNPSDTVKAELVFMAIKDAYETLSDPSKRKRYDRL
jgi:hypothetical protein